MSYRDIHQVERAFQKFVEETRERLVSLEQGSAHRGRVSFGPVLRIGDIEVSAIPGGGDEDRPYAIRLLVRNVLTDSEQVLAVLP